MAYNSTDNGEHGAEGTLGDEIRRAIADEILEGKIPVGTRLDETELASRFDVSRTPIREALRQLSSIGLIEHAPRRSAVVAPVDALALAMSYEAAAELEGITAGLAAIRADLTQKLLLTDLNTACADLVEDGDAISFANANREFHNEIARLARNDSLATATMVVRVKIAPFQRFQFEHAEERGRSVREHSEILQAIVRGDQAGATAAMRQHVLRASFRALRKINEGFQTK